MQLPRYQWIGQMLATIGVIISLGLVAYELKQSRDVAVAELTLSVTNEDVELKRSVLDVQMYYRANKKLRSGEALDFEERDNIFNYYDMLMLNVMSKHLLWSMGLLTDGEWESARAEIKHLWANNPFFSNNYAPDKTIAVRGPFLAEFEKMWAELKAEQQTEIE